MSGHASWSWSIVPTRAGIAAATAIASLAIVPALASTIVGCGSEPKPAPKTEAAPEKAKPAATPPVAKKTDTAKPSSGSIHIDDKIRNLCGDLPETHFAFDSADVGPTAGVLLDPLAKCFISGPAKGKG